jgi:ABC-type sulfate/molybdate transport systems ATPase subunit
MLLLDEPLAALDATARRSVRGFLAGKLRALGRPSIVVTHDVRDVLALDADVCVVEAGRVVQRGRVPALRAEPASDFVAEFVGAGDDPAD